MPGPDGDVDVDVVVCGYGPVGAVLAARLGAFGLRVLVVDREATPYPLPRAVAADDEVQRLLARTAPGLLEGAVCGPAVRFVDRGRRPLGMVRFPAAADGTAGLAFFSQPLLESRLRTHVDGLPAVTVQLGIALTGWHQDPGGITVRISDGSSVRARWLVGCDGASSFVRRQAGVAFRGRDLADRWLVVDVAGEVADRRDFTYTCDPDLPQVDLPTPGGHRWEWLLRDPTPDRTSPDRTAPDPAVQDRAAHDPELLLRRDIDPGSVRVVRATTYRYGARRAERWQVGRVLLAGDAAHTMPPFAGQGLGAGIRDAWSLSWRLANGDPSGYQAERASHVRAATRLSLLLGTILQAGTLGTSRDLLLRSVFRSPVLGPWLRRGGPRTTDSGVLSSYDAWLDRTRREPR